MYEMLFKPTAVSREVIAGYSIKTGIKSAELAASWSEGRRVSDEGGY